MKKLTIKEEEIMNFYWEKGPMFVKELVTLYANQKLHYNTLSTMVRALEEKGFLDHEQFGNTYRYFPVISQEDYRKGTLNQIVTKYFNNSYKSVVSQFVANEDISIDELKKIIQDIEENSSK